MSVVVNNLTLKMGGEAGQGVESSGAGFTKAISRAETREEGLAILLMSPEFQRR